MTPQEFDDFLFRTRAELSSAFAPSTPPNEQDVHTKLILDYQERIARVLMNTVSSLETQIAIMKGDILKDARERMETMVKEVRALADKP